MLRLPPSLQVDDLIDHAASLISVIDDVRPLDPSCFNASYEIWKALAAIPPGDRFRVLDELEPGAVRSLWKHSVARYVLGPQPAAELFEGYSVWDDFPDEPGQVSCIWGVASCLLSLDQRFGGSSVVLPSPASAWKGRTLIERQQPCLQLS